MHIVCRHCAASFSIDASDVSLLERIAPVIAGKKELIPLPTLCPDCRQQRRLAWRNERNVFRRTCDFTGKPIISMYPPDAPFKVYEQEVWWSDKWSALQYGRDFDFNRPFFPQFRDLQLQVPRCALVNKQSENCHFTNHSGKNRNCYMSSIVFQSEDIYYSDWVIGHCRDCIDCSYLNEGCELCYETYYAWGSYRAFFCDFVRRCEEVWFCSDCINCKNCFLCSNLRNKQYCFRNEQCTPEEYRRKIQEVFPLSHARLVRLREEYRMMQERTMIHPANYQLQSEDCSGDLIFQSKDCVSCFDAIAMHNCRHCYDSIDTRDSMDAYHVGWAEMMYECHAISHAYQCLACHFTYDCKNCMYCDCAQNSHDLFGCVGMNRGSYCILNKQYTKEEYENLVSKIICHMRHDGGWPAMNPSPSTTLKAGPASGSWGEFFPMMFSPFAYNQSRAQEFYPLTKEETEERKCRWSDDSPPLSETSATIAAKDLPENSADVTDDILQSVIRCEVSGKPFRLIRQEQEFYRKAGLPLPRRHPDQRYKDRFAQRRPRRLWQRFCQKCGKGIETAFSPERSEKVWCEACYQAEV